MTSKTPGTSFEPTEEQRKEFEPTEEQRKEFEQMHDRGIGGDPGDTYRDRRGDDYYTPLVASRWAWFRLGLVSNSDVEQLRATVKEQGELIDQQASDLQALQQKHDELLEAAANVLNFSTPTCLNDEKWRDQVASMVAGATKCCKITSEEKALLASGDYRPEELWGGSKPTCPKCIGTKSAQTATAQVHGFTVALPTIRAQIGGPGPELWLEPEAVIAAIEAAGGTIAGADPDESRKKPKPVAAQIREAMETRAIVGKPTTLTFGGATLNVEFRGVKPHYRQITEMGKVDLAIEEFDEILEAALAGGES